MSKNILCCGVLLPEVRSILKDININIRAIDLGLHVDYKKIASSITDSLKEFDSEDTAVIIGNQCHPDML